jgi:tripartite-type tricarboxylate transporter receptor subunit TctC
VDNRGSASGTLAAEIVKAAVPDGYTLFMAYHQHTVNAALLKLSYHPVNDFTPITQLTEAGIVLVVHPSAPPKNFKEFLDWTRNYKGALNYGSAGLGSGGHLGGELYKLQAGVKATHIPYKGAGPALIALMGNEFQYTFAGLVGALPLARAGKIRALAVTTEKRIPGYEDIPTVKESGLPDYVVVGWYGVLTPPKLPKPLMTRLHAELVKVLRARDQQAHRRLRRHPGRERPGVVPQVHARRHEQVGRRREEERRQGRLIPAVPRFSSLVTRYSSRRRPWHAYATSRSAPGIPRQRRGSISRASA